ncbi:hypothetical protein Bhyg_03366 [Pseudolycoriella hygida]|uniref:Uncharacterized protein n=1 Tax=Pseudolycoriella hygida TaxID=35572 RepID=A0A9Q0NEJ4_9DIPT|nr:hypothetical protein Bhyg_03366 [Pseudolycoriella hygida]
MLLKLILLSVVLLKSVIADNRNEDNDKKVSFSVEKIWRSYQKKHICICEVDDDWKAGVQEYFTETRKATWKFRGPSYDLADNVMWTKEKYLTKLMYLANTNSTVLASSSTSILETMSTCHKLGKSGLIIISEFEKVLFVVIKEFKEVVSKLSEFIGTLATSFNEALTRLFMVFSNFMERFLKCTTVKCKVKIDYAPVVKKYQNLMNVVALIAETLINKCDKSTREAYQAVTILSLTFQYFSLAVQGINSCVQDILFKENGVIAENIRSLSESMHYVLLDITQAIDKIVYPFDESIRELLTILVNVTMVFNTSVKRTSLGEFKGVLITVGEISQSLFKDVAVDVTNDRTNFLKGIILK